MSNRDSCSIYSASSAILIGRILLIAASILLSVACISVLIAVVHCYRATALARHPATGALALPISLLPEDQTLLHTEPEHPVPMLSVQTAGCAGMERLGVPTRTTLNSPPDDRGQFSCRMRVDALLAVRGETVIHNNTTGNANTSSSSAGDNNRQHHQHHQHQHNQQQQQHKQHSHHHHQHYQRMTTPNNSGSSGSNSNPARSNNNSINSSSSNTPTTSNTSSSNVARGGIEATTLKYGNTGSGSSSGNSNQTHNQHYQHNYPHHVALPDSEWGPDRNLQIRTAYQQSEITRSYIKPPPNKTVKDVPEPTQYSFYTLHSSAAVHASTSSLTQPHFATNSLHHHQQQQQQPQQQQQHSQPHKSKPNVIAKFFFPRKSSPKSPTALSASSSASSLASSATSSSVSTSSSASSLSSAPLSTLPISTAAALKTTACSCGPSLVQSAATQSSAANNILAGLAHSSQLLTTIVTPTAAVLPSPTGQMMERIPTPPLSVSIPLAYQQQRLPDGSTADSTARLKARSPSGSADGEVATTSAAAAAALGRRLTASPCNCGSKGCNDCAANTTLS